MVSLFLRRSQALFAYQQQVMCVTRLLEEVKILRKQVILHFAWYLIMPFLIDRCNLVHYNHIDSVFLSCCSCICVCVCVCVHIHMLPWWLAFQLDLQREEVDRLHSKLEQEKRKRHDIGVCTGANLLYLNICLTVLHRTQLWGLKQQLTVKPFWSFNVL